MTQTLKCQIMLKFLNMNEQNIKRKVQVVVVAQNEILLMEFNNEIPNNYVGFQNITGAVEEGENFLEAAIRELNEEAGIESEVIELNLNFEFFDRWKKNCQEKVYLCHLDKKPKIILNEEHLFYKWLPLNEIKESDFTFISNFQAAIEAKKYLEQR